VEALPITQERQRAQRAIELAQWGLTVAVVSSGDCGIYGMAGLVLEELQDLAGMVKLRVSAISWYHRFASCRRPCRDT